MRCSNGTARLCCTRMPPTRASKRLLRFTRVTVLRKLFLWKPGSFSGFSIRHSKTSRGARSPEIRAHATSTKRVNCASCWVSLHKGLRFAQCRRQPAAGLLQPEQALQIQPPQVMQSGAGYYVGCYCLADDGFPSPYNRYSDYFPKREKAQIWLDKALAEGVL